MDPSQQSDVNVNRESIVLPSSIVGITDVNRLHREMLAFDDFIHQVSIRQPGTPVTLPKMSKLFDELVESNNLNMLKQEDRQSLQEFIEQVRSHSPRLHISFSADPSPLFLRKLMDYLRSTIHPVVLVQVGLQPTIGAGCVVRSTNKVFDLSLREDFRKKRPLLMKQIGTLNAAAEKARTEVQPA